MQYIVTGRDGTDPEAPQRRLAVRQKHIELGDKLRAEGKVLFGVAILDESEAMRGSIYIVDFPSRQELDAWLEIEPYVTGNVWQTIDITPGRVGPSFEDMISAP